MRPPRRFEGQRAQRVGESRRRRRLLVRAMPLHSVGRRLHAESWFLSMTPLYTGTRGKPATLCASISTMGAGFQQTELAMYSGAERVEPMSESIIRRLDELCGGTR
jgi:hypothetical protein